MRIIWTELAKYKLKEAFQYYKEVAGINVANSIKKKIYQKTRKLSRFPEIGQKEANPAAGSYDYHYVVSGHYKIVIA